MNLFGKLIPAWMWFAIIGVLAALVLVQEARIARKDARFATYKAEAERIARLWAEATRRLETNRQTAVDKEVKDAQPIIAAEKRDADTARVDTGVRDTATRIIRAACPNPRPAATSAPAADPIMVFADVLGRIEQRADDLAALAGERGTAGALCERSYDGVRGAAATR